MAKKAIVLGAGMVGSVMAADLATGADFEVTLADRRPEALAKASARSGAPIKTIVADLADAAALKRLVAPFDVVLGAAASAIGFEMLRAVIEAGKHYCDISFMPEDAMELDALAKDRGVTAVVDCGVAPGMSNLLVGRGAAMLDECERIEIYVGGLPRERRWPFEYKAGFAPSDVIEEYTRPSRIVEHGRIVVREALSEPELMNFNGVGTLEAFNTDGLRSLAYTMRAPFMKEKTLRYPGHIELMRVLRETGLFGKDEIEVGGVRVRPLDVTSALMFPKWTYEEGEEDLTVMRIIVEGPRAGRRTRLTWDLLDFYDKESRATSMARTTALPCAIMARMIADETVSARGVLPPELIGPDERIVSRMLQELQSRNVHYTFNEQTIE